MTICSKIFLHSWRPNQHKRMNVFLFFHYLAKPFENGAVYLKWNKTFERKRQQITSCSWFSGIGCRNKRRSTRDTTAHFLGCQRKVEIPFNPPTSAKEVTNDTQHLNSTQWRAAGGFTALARRCRTPLGTTVLVWKNHVHNREICVMEEHLQGYKP